MLHRVHSYLKHLCEWLFTSHVGVYRMVSKTIVDQHMAMALHVSLAPSKCTYFGSSIHVNTSIDSGLNLPDCDPDSNSDLDPGSRVNGAIDSYFKLQSCLNTVYTIAVHIIIIS